MKSLLTNDDVYMIKFDWWPQFLSFDFCPDLMLMLIIKYVLTSVVYFSFFYWPLFSKFWFVVLYYFWRFSTIWTDIGFAIHCFVWWFSCCRWLKEPDIVTAIWWYGFCCFCPWLVLPWFFNVHWFVIYKFGFYRLINFNISQFCFLVCDIFSLKSPFQNLGRCFQRPFFILLGI